MLSNTAQDSHAEAVLTPREQQVHNLRDLTARDVALRLGLSPNTVATYRQIIRRKLSGGRAVGDGFKNSHGVLSESRFVVLLGMRGTQTVLSSTVSASGHCWYRTGSDGTADFAMPVDNDLIKRVVHAL